MAQFALDFPRRQILGNHPGTAAEFIVDCRKYFQSIAFNDYCIKSLVDDDYQYLLSCPRKIVYYLSCLNDKFSDVKSHYKTGEYDANDLLADFSGKFGLDIAGSMQQNYKKKGALTFAFRLTDGKELKDGSSPEKIEVLCESHIKIARPDSNYSGVAVGKDYNPRIYFNYDCNSLIENGKILVGMMGKHVE